MLIYPGFRGCCPRGDKPWEARSPLLSEEGGRDLKQLSASMLGAAGRVRPFLTTPSALSKDASRYFLDAQPPLLSEGGYF